MTPEIVLALDVPQLLNLLLAVIFPVLVGLVTTKVTSGTIKAVLLASISLASGLVSALLTAVLAGVPFDLIAALLTGFAAWIIAIATHLGFWKPSGVTQTVQAIGAGPVGDGVTDDTRALQKLVGKGGLDALNALPPGEYRVTAPIRVPGLTAVEAEAVDPTVSPLLRRDLKGD